MRFDVLNVFDNAELHTRSPNPRHRARRSSSTTSAYTDASNTYDPGGRIGQLMFRFNW